MQVAEMRPEDLGFSFIRRPRLYIILARRNRIALGADAFSLFRKMQAKACRQPDAPPAVMAAADKEVLDEENSARASKGMPPVQQPSRCWRYLLPKSRLSCLEAHREVGHSEVTASVLDLSQSVQCGRRSVNVPTLRRSTVKPLRLLRHNRWLVHSELAAMMGFPVSQMWSQAAGVPLDTATLAGPPAALGNAMHVACVGVAVACAFTAARYVD